MNKKIIFSVSLFLLVGLMVVISAIQLDLNIKGYGVIGADFQQNSIQVVEGWNLIKGFPSPEWIFDGDISQSQIKAIYTLDPSSQEYIRFYPENNDLSETQISMDYLIGNTAFWVYADGSGEMEYYTMNPQPINQRQLLKGWNFIGITQEIVGKTTEEMKGSCVIEKSYAWNSEAQEWTIGLNEVVVGTGMLVKVSSDCKLGESSNGGSVLPPPQIPQGSSSSCSDSDGGYVIDVKGITGDLSTEDAYNDVCFIKESSSETTSTSECSGSNCYLKEYHCDSQTGNSVSDDFSCSERGFTSCKQGACI